MRYGVCFGIEYPERVAHAAKAGFDYVECGFCNLSRAEDEVFEKFKAALEENHIRCEAANGFFPGDLSLIGEKYNEEAVKDYVRNGLRRGREIGLKTVVFGSGGARSVPDGVSCAEGFRQLGQVLGNVVAPLLEEYGVTVVTEPLRKEECNIINTVKEGVMLSVLSGKENISCLADIYHMVGVGDTYEDIRQLKGSIKHGHISNPEPKNGLKRCFPKGLEEFDYQGFIDALSYAGATTCSVEAQCMDFETEIYDAGRLLKSLK